MTGLRDVVGMWRSDSRFETFVALGVVLMWVAMIWMRTRNGGDRRTSR